MKQLSALKPRFRGPSGRELLLRADLQYLQWQLQGDVNWQNLASLDDLAPGKMPKTGGVFTGNIQVRNVVETLVPVSSSEGLLVVDLSQGNVFNLNLTENVFVMDIGNLPTGAVTAFTILITQNATQAKTFNWLGSTIPIKWASDANPAITTELNKTDIYSFLTIDQGLSFFGFVSGQAY